ncbi:MAG: integrase core domain-containing protein [Acidobacteriota bacterium]
MLATLRALGVPASFDKPHVSDDNPCSESLSRTLKCRPEYPSTPFESLEAAAAWVDGFVRWYDEEHLHNGVGFVTTHDRHAGRHREILSRRRSAFQSARERLPEGWGGRGIRRLDPVETVTMHDGVQEMSAAA